MVRYTGSLQLQKYATRWTDARVSPLTPESGFCIWHHNPPPAVSTLLPDAKCVVFGFLERQDAQGTWHRDWPYQVYADLGVVGPAFKKVTVKVGTGAGECWFDFGKLPGGSYIFVLDFKGDGNYDPASAQGGFWVIQKFKTRWRDARVSGAGPMPGFCITHHDPPIAADGKRLTTEDDFVVFGFLEWQDSAGTWRGDWPYQVYADLGVVGPTTKTQRVPVGMKVGEAWYNFGRMPGGNYTYTLDFKGDDRYEDGATQTGFQIPGLEPDSPAYSLLAGLPILFVLSIIWFQEAQRFLG